jgi:transient receptor potential cation channel subfamily A protein 1
MWFFRLSCSLWRVNVGAVAIFLAWIVLVLFVRKFPMFGIYIVMFEDIVLTFLRFSIILVLFVVAFGLSFYTTLHRHWVSACGRHVLKKTYGHTW